MTTTDQSRPLNLDALYPSIGFITSGHSPQRSSDSLLSSVPAPAHEPCCSPWDPGAGSWHPGPPYLFSSKASVVYLSSIFLLLAFSMRFSVSTMWCLFLVTFKIQRFVFPRLSNIVPKYVGSNALTRVQEKPRVQTQRLKST